MNDVLLQLLPSLPFPPQPPRKVSFVVRLVHRYYGAVRLLQHVHVRITVYGLHRAAGTPRAGVGKVADQPTITGSRCVQSLRSVSSDSLSFRGPELFVICDEASRVTLRFLSFPIPPTMIRAIPVGTPNQSPKGCASTAPCHPVFCPCTTSIWMASLWRSLSGSSR
jgi:hypothetical protein